MSPLAGNKSLMVFGEELFKKLLLCCEGFMFKSVAIQEKQPERRPEGAGGGYYNDFLRSLC